MITTLTKVPRWTTAILPRFLALNISSATRSYPAPALHISAHSRSYASRSSLLSPEKLKLKKQEARARNTERNKLRYHSDPEYRERVKQNAAAKYATNPEYREMMIRSSKKRYATNPEYREMRIRSSKERYAANPKVREKLAQYVREKLDNDLEYRDKTTKANTKNWHRVKSNLNQNPEAYPLLRHKKSKTHRTMYDEDTEYRWALVLRSRLRNERFRNEVVWRSHKPVFYPTKTDHNCATCRHKRYGGLKLWWRRKNESDKYDCPRCFFADREASTPTYIPSDLAPLPNRGPVE